MARTSATHALRALLRPLSLVGQTASRGDLWATIFSRSRSWYRFRASTSAPYAFELSDTRNCTVLRHGPGLVRVSAAQLREDLLIAMARASCRDVLIDLMQTGGRADWCSAFLFEHVMSEDLNRLSHVAFVVKREHLCNAYVDRTNALRHGLRAEVFTDRRAAENWLLEFSPTLATNPIDAEVCRVYGTKAEISGGTGSG